MTSEQKQCLELQEQGMTRAQIAEHTGLSKHQVKRRLAAAKNWQAADPAIRDAAIAGGLSDPSTL